MNNAVVLVDGSNFSAGIRREVRSADDLAAFEVYVKLLRARLGLETSFRYYRAVFADDDFRRLNDRLRGMGVHPVLFNQRSRIVDCRQCGGRVSCEKCREAIPEAEKCVDVAIAVDALHFAYEDKTRVLAVVTSDADFYPLLLRLLPLMTGLELHCFAAIAPRLDDICRRAQEEHGIVLKHRIPVRSLVKQAASEPTSAETDAVLLAALERAPAQWDGVLRSGLADLAKFDLRGDNFDRALESALRRGVLRCDPRTKFISPAPGEAGASIREDSAPADDAADFVSRVETEVSRFLRARGEVHLPALATHLNKTFPDLKARLASMKRRFRDWLSAAANIEMSEPTPGNFVVRLAEPKSVGAAIQASDPFWTRVRALAQDFARTRKRPIQASALVSQLQKEGLWSKDAHVAMGLKTAREVLELGAKLGYFAIRTEGTAVFIEVDPRRVQEPVSSVVDS